jgi:hypothetical protein
VIQTLSNGCENAFLNGVVQEEVCVRQPLRFENLEYSNRVQALKKFVRA